jgi:hypothetical protein
VHDEAMTNHDLKGVIACLTEKLAILWHRCRRDLGWPDEIKVASEHFFEGFDKGDISRIRTVFFVLYPSPEMAIVILVFWREASIGILQPDL